MAEISNKNGTTEKCHATVTTSTTSDGTVVRRGKNHIHSSSELPGTSAKVMDGPTIKMTEHELVSVSNKLPEMEQLACPIKRCYNLTPTAYPGMPDLGIIRTDRNGWQSKRNSAKICHDLSQGRSIPEKWGQGTK